MKNKIVGIFDKEAVIENLTIWDKAFTKKYITKLYNKYFKLIKVRK